MLGVSGWRGGEREEVGVQMGQGGGRTVQGLCGAFEDRRCWQVVAPPAAQGLSVVQPLPGCTRWLRAIPAGPREISGEHDMGAGSREQVRDHSMAECFGGKFPFEGTPARPMPPWGTRVHKTLVPIATLPASAQDAVCPLLLTQEPVVAPHMAAPAAPRVPVTPYYAGAPRSCRAVTGAAMPALSANLQQHRCVLCSAWSSSGTSIPPHPAEMVRECVRHPATGGQGGAEGPVWLSFCLGTLSTGSCSLRCCSCLSQHPPAGSTALQEQQAVRCWHLSLGDNKSYQCKPIRRQEDNPCDNPARAELHLHRVAAVDLQINATAGGTSPLPSPPA